MERHRGSALTLLAGLAATLLLAACGGGGTGAGASTSASAPAAPPTSPGSGLAQSGGPAAVRAKPRARKQPAPEMSSSQPSSHSQLSARLVRKAGHAAPFLVPQGDNSVPTYGSEADTGERAAAEAELKSFLTARARGDWSSACRYLAVSTRAQLEGFAKKSGAKWNGCGPILKTFAGSGSPSSLADPMTQGLLSLRIKGNNAFALFIGPHRQKYAMPMTREGGSWRLTQFAPLPFPPGSGSEAP